MIFPLGANLTQKQSLILYSSSMLLAFKVWPTRTYSSNTILPQFILVFSPQCNKSTKVILLSILFNAIFQTLPLHKVIGIKMNAQPAAYISEKKIEKKIETPK